MDKISGLMSCVSGPDSKSGCIGQTLSLNEQGVQALVGQVVSIATTFIVVLAGYANLDDNMLLALNAGRCAISNGFYNVWYLIAAAMFMASQFGLQNQIQMYFNQYYPIVCGCYYYASQIQSVGASNKQTADKIATYFSSCDEYSMVLRSCTDKNGVAYSAIYCQ